MSSKSGNHRSNAVVATNPQIVSLGYVVGENNPTAVSYTHLTLPTIYTV